MISTRRLAAILAADVVGFSGLMEKDEEGTVRRIHALRTGVIDPGLAAHRGRLVKTTGDGFLAEFASPIAAVGFAVQVQRTLNADPDGLRLRVGINLGDIIVEDDGDVYGEGVNIAARLEALCDPGSVLVSSKIHEEVDGKVEASFEDQGEKHVKNISKLVRVFAVREPGEAPAPGRAAPVRARRAGLRIAAAALAAVLVLAGAGAWLRFGAATPPAGPGQSGAAAEAGAFDGVWRVVIECPPVETPRAAGYVQRLSATVSGGNLRGSMGTPGQPGWFQIEGPVQPTGRARLSARGLVNNPAQAVGGAAAGSIFEYTVDVTFDGRSGRGRRTQLRPCELTFDR